MMPRVAKYERLNLKTVSKFSALTALSCALNSASLVACVSRLQPSRFYKFSPFTFQFSVSIVIFAVNSKNNNYGRQR